MGKKQGLKKAVRQKNSVEVLGEFLFSDVALDAEKQAIPCHYNCWRGNNVLFNCLGQAVYCVNVDFLEYDIFLAANAFHDAPSKR